MSRNWLSMSGKPAGGTSTRSSRLSSLFATSMNGTLTCRPGFLCSDWISPNRVMMTYLGFVDRVERLRHDDDGRHDKDNQRGQKEAHYWAPPDGVAPDKTPSVSGRNGSTPPVPSSTTKIDTPARTSCIVSRKSRVRVTLVDWLYSARMARNSAASPRALAMRASLKASAARMVCCAAPWARGMRSLLVGAGLVDARLLVGAGGHHVVERRADGVRGRYFLKGDFEDLDACVVVVHQGLKQGLRVLLHRFLADGEDVVH